jgi:NAD(P)H dehydrogenase (quinone)
MSKLLLIVGHSNPNSFTSALANAYQRAASLAGAQMERIDLSALQFDLVLRQGDGEAQPLEPDLVAAQATIRRAQHVVWFFPTWWAAPPALVKGFVDRVFLPGYAYAYEKGRLLHHKLLGGRSARLVTSMDAPWWWYAVFYRRALHASFINATLRFVGFAPIYRTTIYGLKKASAQRRAQILEDVCRQATQDATRLVRRSTLRLATRLPVPEHRAHAQDLPPGAP